MSGGGREDTQIIFVRHVPQRFSKLGSIGNGLFDSKLGFWERIFAKICVFGPGR